MRIQIGQIALPAVDPKASFKIEEVRVFCGRSTKSHLIEKSGVRSQEISASSLYPKMLKKTMVVRGFSEDLARNFLFENKGVIWLGGKRKKREPLKMQV